MAAIFQGAVSSETRFHAASAALPRTAGEPVSLCGASCIVSVSAFRIRPAATNPQQGTIVKIREIREIAVPINSTLRNAVFDFSEMTLAIVAGFGLGAARRTRACSASSPDLPTTPKSRMGSSGWRIVPASASKGRTNCMR